MLNINKMIKLFNGEYLLEGNVLTNVCCCFD